MGDASAVRGFSLSISTTAPGEAATSDATPDPYGYSPPDLTARDARIATPISDSLAAALECLLPGYCPDMTYDAHAFGPPSEGADGEDAPPVP